MSKTSFDDFKEVETSVGLAKINYKDGPQIGETVEGRKIKRVRAISATEFTKKAVEEDLDENSDILFKQHARRPFVMWMIELEKKYE